MGKGFMRFLVVFLVCIMVVSLGMVVYDSRKSNDNLPALVDFAAMEDEEANRKISGYMENQLLEVWGKPRHSNSQEMVWELPDSVLLVYSGPRGEITGCSIKRTADLPRLSDFSNMSMGRMTGWLIGRFYNQVVEIWGKPSGTEDNWVYWTLPENSAYSAVRVESNAWGKIQEAEFVLR